MMNPSNFRASNRLSPVSIVAIQATQSGHSAGIDDTGIVEEALSSPYELSHIDCDAQPVRWCAALMGNGAHVVSW